MQLLIIYIVLAVLAVAVQGLTISLRRGSPDTVDALTVPAFLGLWYQMAGNEFVFKTSEKDTYCATAAYGDNGDGTLSVHNYARITGPTGSIYTIDGYAYQTDAEKEPGQLKVVFKSPDAAPIPAPYWILELGPLNAQGLYDWAIVSDNMAVSLFVLARDVNVYNTQYKAQVESELVALGFTGKSAKVDLYQGADCIYESTLRAKEMALFKEQKL
eukprot:gene25361-30622_t